MKKIAQLIIVLNSIVASSQEKLLGTYCSTPIGESDVTCITFKENNQFYYTVSGCLGISNIGNGTFEIQDKSLKLNFHEQEQIIRSSVNIKEIESDSEYIEIEFVANDEHGQKLPCSIVEIANPENEFKIHPFELEKNKYKFEKVDKVVKYQISFIGYESIDFDLNFNSSKIIEFTMFPGYPKVISDKTYEWKFLDLTEDGFKTGSNVWNTFRKIEN